MRGRKRSGKHNQYLKENKYCGIGTQAWWTLCLRLYVCLYQTVMSLGTGRTYCISITGVGIWLSAKQEDYPHLGLPQTGQSADGRSDPFYEV